MGSELYESKPRSYYNAVKRGVVDRLVDEHLGRILDVGGGDGATVSFLIGEGRANSAVVMDPFSEADTAESVTFSRDSADDMTSFDRLAAEGAPFDTIMFLDVFEHLVDPWATLEATRKVHAEEGRLVVCMPNARFVALTVPLVLFGRFDYKPSGIMDKTHIRWFTRSGTVALIEGAGYRIDRIDDFIEPRVALVNRLTLGLFRGFFEYQYIVQATKVA